MYWFEWRIWTWYLVILLKDSLNQKVYDKKRHYKTYQFGDLLKYKFLRFSLLQIMAQKNPASSADGFLRGSLVVPTVVWNNQEHWSDVLPCSTKELPLYLLAITNFSMFHFSKYSLSVQTVVIIYSAYIHDISQWCCACCEVRQALMCHFVTVVLHSQMPNY